MNTAALHDAVDPVTARLLAARNAAGHWEGELSSSALSTATGLFALHLYVRHADPARFIVPAAQINQLIRGGIAWLIRTQNPDGGWGDTIRSKSNISTTALCWAALSAAGSEASDSVARAEAWLRRAAGSLEPKSLARAIGDRYGKDRTFSVPILTMCALAGRLGDDRSAWRHVPQLPFELAACPYRWFQIVRLPVVSYALPALIAMGHVRHFRRPTRNPITRLLRWLTHGRTLRVLESIQPRGGGFLEATPLTSFVAMSLIGAGQVQHPVVRDGVDFLIRSVRPDGSWPIDTNLATWVTTLSINALATHPDFDAVLADADRRRLRDWLLGQQYRVEHPYTHAAPGGWAWTDLPGGVPDADDTAGALLALWHLSFGWHGHVPMPVSSYSPAFTRVNRSETHRSPLEKFTGVNAGLYEEHAQVLDAVHNGVRWLLDLQNRDGGIPTFCRGWGALPFDRSGSDLTAHVLHAWAVWKHLLPDDLHASIKRATAAALEYLRTHQRADGAWPPLWFGNESCDDEQNLTYGTSRVLAALGFLAKSDSELRVSEMIRRGVDWLTSAQNRDGSWGGGAQTTGSLEETSLAITALTAVGNVDDRPLEDAIMAGLAHLDLICVAAAEFTPAPIGFYFAKLWYFEKLYPLIFAAGAMGLRRDIIRAPSVSDG